MSTKNTNLKAYDGPLEIFSKIFIKNLKKFGIYYEN